MNQTLMTSAQIAEENAVSPSVVSGWVFKGKIVAVARQGMRKYYARNQVEKTAGWYNRNDRSVTGMPYVEPRGVEFSPGMVLIDAPTQREAAKERMRPAGVSRKLGHVPTPEDLFKLVESIDKIACRVEALDDSDLKNKSRAGGEVKSLAKMAALLEGVVVALYGDEYAV